MAVLKFIFPILILIATFGQVTADLYLSSLPFIAEEFQTDSSHAQLTVSFYMLGFAFSQLFYGPLSDGIGRKKPLIAGLLLAMVGGVICMTAHDMKQLYFGRVLQGLGAGAGVALARSMLRDTYEGNDLVSLAAYLSVASVTVLACAPMVGGYIQAWFSWRVSFGVLNGHALLVLLLVCFVLPETNRYKSRENLKWPVIKENIKTLLTSRLYMGCIGLMLLGYANFLFWLTAAPILLIETLHVPPEKYGWWSMMVGFGYAFGGLTNGRLVKRLGKKMMMQMGLVIMLVGGVLLLTPAFFNHLSVLSVTVPVFIMFLGANWVIVSSFVTGLSIFPKITGTASAVGGFTQILGGALASSWMSSMPETNQIPLGASMLAITCLANLIYYRIVRDRL